MESFPQPIEAKPGFSKKITEEGLIPALRSFEHIASEKKRIQIKDNPIFEERYGAQEVHADTAEADSFFRKYFQGDGAEFRPSMLAEELVKVGGEFGLFGNRAEIMQASQYDDYKHNTDFIVTVQNDIRDKKDEEILRARERFILDVTTDQGDRLKEKAENLAAELRNGKLTEVKYFPATGGTLSDVPRFVLQVNEEELLAFFKKAKPVLDCAGKVDRKEFTEKYDTFSQAACEKILSGARAQVENIVQWAKMSSLPYEVAAHIATLLSSRLGEFHQTLEYVDTTDPASFDIKKADDKIKVSRYLAMIKTVLRVGVAIERVLEEKEKRASTQQVSEALH
jgi:hypothetical protein